MEVGVMDLSKRANAEPSPVVFARANNWKDHITRYVTHQVSSDNITDHGNFNQELWIKICVSVWYKILDN